MRRRCSELGAAPQLHKVARRSKSAGRSHQTGRREAETITRRSGTFFADLGLPDANKLSLYHRCDGSLLHAVQLLSALLADQRCDRATICRQERFR